VGKKLQYAQMGIWRPIMATRFFHWTLLLIPCIVCPALLCGDSGLTADQIVQRSVSANDADWEAAPDYAYTENDAIVKGGRTIRKKYEVLMILGSTYNKLLAVDGEPLSPVGAREEERKLRQEILRRGNESPDVRRKRIAKFSQARRQDHELVGEMAKAFQYKLLGNEMMNGRLCFVLEATPKAGYSPPNRDTKVLTGMRGKLWIDTDRFQWVKVHAEVFRPVAFGLFIAHVQPGTQFTLEEAPVRGDIWLPTHFETVVKASILGFWSRDSSDDETYTDYRPMSQVLLSQTSTR
jgi:hypothetical protein